MEDIKELLEKHREKSELIDMLEAVSEFSTYQSFWLKGPGGNNGVCLSFGSDPGHQQDFKQRGWEIFSNSIEEAKKEYLEYLLDRIKYTT